jgi:hypothetical protein
MKRIHFFAVKEDLLPVLEEFESKGPLKYVRTGLFLKKNYDSFDRGAEIERLGRATADTASSCETFLVCKREAIVNVRLVMGGAVQRFAIDQLLNPDTVVFTPAGLWNDDVILHGRLATISDRESAQELMKRFYAAIRRYSSKIKAYWVGPKALAFLESGKRLTIAVQSPREFDLKISTPT